MPRRKPLARSLVEGTDMRVLEKPSYIRIAGPETTVAYGYYRADGSLRLDVRRVDGQYPDRLVIEDIDDIEPARARLENAERKLERVLAAA